MAEEEEDEEGEEAEGEEDFFFAEKASPDDHPALKVDKETNTDTVAPSPTVVGPKDRRAVTPSPGPFLPGEHHHPLQDLLPRAPEPVPVPAESERQ